MGTILQKSTKQPVTMKVKLRPRSKAPFRCMRVERTGRLFVASCAVQLRGHGPSERWTLRPLSFLLHDQTKKKDFSSVALQRCWSKLEFALPQNCVSRGLRVERCPGQLVYLNACLQEAMTGTTGSESVEKEKTRLAREDEPTAREGLEGLGPSLNG